MGWMIFDIGTPSWQLAQDHTAELAPFLARRVALLHGTRLKRLELRHSWGKDVCWEEREMKTENDAEVEEDLAPLRRLVEGPVVFKVQNVR